MPSGSKKRKADKKKKAKEEAHINKSSQHGNDDTKSHVDKDSDDCGVKSHDVKESDGSELSSPASQDHLRSHHPFDEGEEEEEKRSSSYVRPFDLENESSNVTLDKMGDKVIEVGNELKLEESSVGRSVPLEYVEFVKESHDGRPFGYNLNTSISNSDNGKEKEKAHDSIPSTMLHDKLVNLDDIVPGKKVSRLIETAQTTEACDSVEESNPVVDSFKPVHSLPQVGACDETSAPVENLVNSSAGHLGFKENEALPLSNDNVEESSREMSFASKENDDQPLPQSDVASVEIGIVTKHVKYSEETPECSENQPLVASAPCRAKTTSWKSCCGLFDVLAGSGR